MLESGSRRTVAVLPMAGPEFSKYVVKQKLRDVGGYLTVFSAHQRGLDRDVELRVLQAVVEPESGVYAKFQAECRALANLDHPGILKILDLGHSSQRIFYVTDPPTGITLKEYIAQGQAPIEVVLEVGVQLGSALEYLHGKGLFHRGLSLAGVNYDLITGRVLISDFSLLKNVVGGVPSMRDLVDTDAFEALPERSRGGEADGRSDIFLVGAILHALLTGQDPLAPQQLARTVEFQFPPPSEKNADVPVELDRLVAKAMSREPEERQESPARLIRDLENARRRTIVRQVSRHTSVQTVMSKRESAASAALAADGGGPPAISRETVLASPVGPSRSAGLPLPGPGGMGAIAGAFILGVGISLFALKTLLVSDSEQPARSGQGALRPSSSRSLGAGRSGGSIRAASSGGSVRLGPISGAGQDIDGKEATPTDIGELVAFVATSPTDEENFSARWEALRAWVETLPTAGQDLPFRPLMLTTVRLKIYRDPIDACLELDTLLEQVGEFLSRKDG